MNSKKLFKRIIMVTLVLVLFIISLNIIIDPYFHYHKPINFLAYPLQYQRYQNDGILRNFDYNALVIGSSMTENFKKTSVDELFDVNSVKVPLSGSSLKETANELDRAFKSNENVKIVIRGIDYSSLDDDKNKMNYDMNMYPDYLYDDILLNDIKYLLNKGTCMSSISVLANTLLGNIGTSFDDYSNWSKNYELGKEHINYNRKEKSNIKIDVTNEDRIKAQENINQNVITQVKNNPNTQFYLFFTPYSILYFDDLNQSNEIEKFFEIEKTVIEELIKYDNVHLFSFIDSIEITCNLDNYRDTKHYGQHINDYILKSMKNNNNIITKDNYIQYCDFVKGFYINYDYDSLF